MRKYKGNTCKWPMSFYNRRPIRNSSGASTAACLLGIRPPGSRISRCPMISAMTTLVGATLSQGRYHVKRKLGEGGMALVFLAHDKNVHVDVVIKMPKPIILAD